MPWLETPNLEMTLFKMFVWKRECRQEKKNKGKGAEICYSQ